MRKIKRVSLLLAAASLGGCAFETPGLGADSGAAASTSDSDPTATTGATTTTTTTDPTSSSTAPLTEGSGSGGESEGETLGPGICGDGVINDREQCDDGPANADEAACTSACKQAFCGDGLVHAGAELCDDGDDLDTNACTNACEPAVCGDGVLHANVELCDDGPDNADTNACKADCTPNTCGDGHLGPGEGCDDGNTLDSDGCSAGCISEKCGDGIKQANELCDDGDNNADTKACKSDCTPNVCGDGALHDGVEECDDNNTIATDACTDTCTNAKCGDGAVQAGAEQCDDKNDNNSDDCANDCKFNGTRVFVTAGAWNGDLGGISGANTKCQVAADSKGLGGAWIAWISTDQSSAADNFKKSNQPYFLLNGVKIANNWADLTNGSLLAAINVTENNTPGANTVRVWTGTNNAGGTTGIISRCDGWTKTGLWAGRTGRRDRTNGEWTNNSTDNCGGSSHLYCFEQ
jgi:cysteine-rich repeat protein